VLRRLNTVFFLVGFIRMGSLPTVTRASEETWTGLYLVLTLLTIYLFTYSGLLHSVDEQSLLSMAQTALSGEGWHVNQMAWEQAWNPPQSALGVDGNLYVYKRGFVVSVLALPLFRLGTIRPDMGAVQAALLMGPLISAATAYPLYRILRRLNTPAGIAMLGVLVWGCGTLAFPYARMLFTEPMTAFAIAVAFDAVSAWRYRRQIGYLLLGGASLGLLFVIKLANVIVIPLFGLYVGYICLFANRGRRPWRSFLVSEMALAAPAAAGLLLLMVYNYHSFGVLLAAPFSDMEGFTTPIWLGLSGLVLSPGKGLLWYVPLTWLLIPALIIGLRSRNDQPERWLALGVLCTLLILYSAWFDWAGGRSWGPRFLVPAIPMLIVLLAPLLTWIRQPQRSLARWLVVAVFVLSLLAQLPAVFANVSVEEGAQLAAGVTSPQLTWDWRHSPLLATGQALLAGRLEPLLLQSYPWQHSFRIMLVVLVSAGLALVGAVSGLRYRRSKYRGFLLLLGTLLLITISGSGMVLAAAGDPRWQETSTEPTENVHLWSFLAGEGGRDDVVLLDLPPAFDTLGRTSIWLNSGPFPPIHIGWERKPVMTPVFGEQLARWLSPHGRIWLSLVGTPPAHPDSTTEEWLNGWAYGGRQIWFGTQRLIEYFTPVETPVLASIGPMQAEGVALTEVSTRQGREPWIRLVDLQWGTVAVPNPRFSLQVLDGQGGLVRQVDGTPAEMATGNERTDRVGIALPEGDYTLILKLYDANSGATVPWQTMKGPVDWLTLEAYAR
jgi:hypothetical protein